MRYFGFFRPWGYKHNAFIFFFTKDPKLHFETIGKQFQRMRNEGFFDTASMFGFNYQSVINFTKKAYPNHKQLYTDAIAAFKKTDPQIEFDPKSKHRKWASVCLTDKQMQKYGNIDELLADLLENKKTN